MHLPTTIFCIDVVNCILVARHSDQCFAVVNSILESSCVISDKELFDKTEQLRCLKKKYTACS